jgi:2-polyprenyl-3-methyl-5-hydroxy-6-metoxy-1,4-benzoquinol methylase
MSVELESTRLSGRVVDRDAFVTGLCAGREVLHLGAADWPFTAEQHRAGRLLHGRIRGVAARVVGVDLSEEGVRYLQGLGYDDVVVGDVERIGELELGRRFDVIVAGEILEHLSNPGLFLQGLRTVAREDARLVVTAPNAFSLKSFLRALLGRELVHGDHVAYLSAATVRHLCARYGYELEQTTYYQTRPLSRVKRMALSPLAYAQRLFSAGVSEGLIAVFRVSTYSIQAPPRQTSPS